MANKESSTLLVCNISKSTYKVNKLLDVMMDNPKASSEWKREAIVEAKAHLLEACRALESLKESEGV